MSKDALEQFSRTAHRAATVVIDAYSTSFSVATKLLREPKRGQIRDIYAMVRVADEIVDGVAAQAGLTVEQQREVLDAFESSVLAAVQTGYSPDVVVHSFAMTAREVGIGRELIEPFFASMRQDLEPEHSAASHDDYVYGSAEVIGLMCLEVFTHGKKYTEQERATLVSGARALGAAFQDINFLRDLADDSSLGRNYLAAEERLSEVEKDQWVGRVRGQLAEARASMSLLPRDARAAVLSAHDLFTAVVDRVQEATVDDLYRRRVRVSDAHKALIVAKAWMNSRKA